MTYSWLVRRSTGDNLRLASGAWSGGNLWDHALNSQGLCSPQVVSVKTELQDTQLVSRELAGVKQPHTSGVRSVLSRKQ